MPHPSGFLKDGFSFQTGAGGASLAATQFLKEIMLKEKIQGSFGLGGIAVNPKNRELQERLVQAGLPVIDIRELKEKTERITGKPNPVPQGHRVVAEVISRDGELLDKIYQK